MINLHKIFSKKLIVILGFYLLCSGQSSASSIAVLDFHLHDLTLNPDITKETLRAASLRGLLRGELVETHKHTVPDNTDQAAKEADKGEGYLFDRPEIAAELGKSVGADWVVSGRLHKASFLFVYLRAQLINTTTGVMASDFVVEIKGPQKKLTAKGVETLALQIHEAVELLEAKQAAPVN